VIHTGQTLHSASGNFVSWLDPDDGCNISEYFYSSCDLIFDLIIVHSDEGVTILELTTKVFRCPGLQI
jgi:hypothetical protein